MPMFDREKILRSVRKTHVILPAVLKGVSAEQARSMTDGPNGWSVVEVVGHLNDWEGVYSERTRRILEENIPDLRGPNQEALVKQGGYATQNVADVLAKLLAARQKHIALLESLTPEQWARTGLYPNIGSVTLVEHATNVAIHDINHIEQIVHILG